MKNLLFLIFFLFTSPSSESKIISTLTQSEANKLKYNDPAFWSHQVEFPAGGIKLKWNVEDEEYVTFDLYSQTRGYVGIGFSHTGSMAGSDIYLGWITNKGDVYFNDYHGGDRNDMPILDKEQNAELLYAEESEEIDGTRFVFRRKWNTCDENGEDIEITEDTMRLIWAWHKDDPSDENNLPYHGRLGTSRGVRSIFMKHRPAHKVFPDNDPTVKYHDFKMKDFEVVRKETYYFCKIVKFPHIDKKHHVIGYKPLVSSVSEPFVHHINLFRCSVPFSVYKKTTGQVLEQYLDHPGTTCYTPDSPIDWVEFCNTHGVAFAVGSEGELYPEHIGDQLEDDGHGTFFKMEVHYENPTNYRLIDSSGVRIYYTEVLREFELATLFLGHRRTPFLSIPPYQKRFTNYGFCTKDCTNVGFPEEGIKVFSVLLHAHLTGRRIILRHIRDGVELEPIAEDKHYDFSYQQYRMLPQERIVLPGDELIVECDFETSENNTFVFGGLSTRREMCEAFVEYYPKSTLIDCRSQPEFYSYFDSFGIKNVTSSFFSDLHLPYDPNTLPKDISQLALIDDAVILENGKADKIEESWLSRVTITDPANLSDLNVKERLDQINWRDKGIGRELMKKWKNGPHYMHCATKGGRRIPLNNHIQYYPSFTKYSSEPSNLKCLLKSSAAAVSENGFGKFLFFFTTFTFYFIFK